MNDATIDRHVVVLGSTGSIGRQALEVLDAMPSARLTGLVAHSNATVVLEQAAAHGVPMIALQREEAARAARQAAGGRNGLPEGLSVRAGDGGVAELIASAAEGARAAGLPLVVLNGIVGAAGLRATLATLEAGATLALANKESLVAGGPFVAAAARASGARVIPVDSEHSALFQCLGDEGPAVEELLLTGSGGPFRTWSDEQLAVATKEQALAHPNWSMGPKITIDSATLMNKGLEVIEAHHLFGVPYERVTVVVNPQSVVHSMVRFSDGAILAHLGVPDMRTPIGFGLGWPRRPALPMVKRLDLLAAEISFACPDLARFPCLRLAIEAGKQAAMVEAEAGCVTGVCVTPPRDAAAGVADSAGGGGSPGGAAGDPAAVPTQRGEEPWLGAPPRTAAAPIVLNAANEVAVQAFLEGQLAFLDIAKTVEKCLSWLGGEPVERLDDVFAVDAEARRFAAETVASHRTSI